MTDASPAVRADIAHLYRRAGFGATAAQLDALAPSGYEAAVDGLLAGLGAKDAAADAVALPTLDASKRGGNGDAKAVRQQTMQLVQWWLGRMTAAEHPLAEKLTWFWHGHFATSVEKVKAPRLMFDQNQLFRTAGAGGWTELVTAVAKDPAMIVWLDTQKNVKAHPNENFARELMELFTLGIGNYSEDDVKASARAFTGWSLEADAGTFVFRPRLHDASAADGEDVIRRITTSPAGDRFLAARLFSRWGRPITPDDPVAADLAGSFAAGGRKVEALVRATLLHPEFRSPATRSGLVKQPVEWLVGALRVLGLPADDERLLVAAKALGQVPFVPPNVGGWPANTAWLTTAAALARVRTASYLVSQRAARGVLEGVAGASVGDRVDAVGHLLSVTWSDATRSSLNGAASDPGTLLAAALSAPEHLLA